MEQVIQYIIGIVGGYLVGGVTAAYFVGKLKGIDIREHGTGNAGASNTVIVIGKRYGAVVVLFDILKAVAVVLLCRYFFPDCTYLPAAAGSACVIGHMFPCFLHFRGGKGFATIAGMMLALDWKLFLIFFVLCILVALLTDYIFLAALLAAVAAPFVMGILHQDWISAACIFPATVCMFLRHKDNFIRLSRGEESGVSALWKKDRYRLAKDRKKDKQNAEQQQKDNESTDQ